MRNVILVGDVREKLREIPDDYVQTVVTSPPYWGLRDYGTSGQIGLEATPEAYVESMVAVMREVRRVLRRDGTVWLNLGDSYTSIGRGGRKESPGVGAKQELAPVARDVVWAPRDEGDPLAHFKWALPGGQKPKDLVGIPWRVAFALQADGWWLRSDVIWSKPNPMPESVTDRPTKSHEYLFLLAKSATYYYDADAIREPAQYGRRVWSDVEANLAAVTNGAERRATHGVRATATVKGADPSAGRNKRTVWEIATQPYAEAHFATFPEELVKPCIQAGCPEGGIVLDPFLGSGTTALVALRAGRDFIGVELNPDYVAMAESRILPYRSRLL